ncbi:hypothetical protein PsorP6_011272 [Peronosclerospora sorghi]|uniref:Uncharacterized protein n=1 Tax=Peronosclerospora sorghi TaxID=230839 RepID=A0ACC0WJD6_9STRA|nr:hypothetical protein PsorP6_011272 [Peronosclerospora sorghi]
MERGTEEGVNKPLSGVGEQVGSPSVHGSESSTWVLSCGSTNRWFRCDSSSRSEPVIRRQNMPEQVAKRTYSHLSLLPSPTHCSHQILGPGLKMKEKKGQKQ